MQRFVQLALDFLTGPEPVVSAPRPAAPRAVAPRSPADAAVPAEPLSAVFQPGTWHHPRANRLLKLGHCEVAYEFKRGKRRTIGLSVTHEGLTVSAPRWTPVGEVEALLHNKADWVLEKLQTHASAPVNWHRRAPCGPMAPSFTFWVSACAWCWTRRTGLRKWARCWSRAIAMRQPRCA